MSEWIKRLAEKYSEVNEKKKVDPVDADELKGTHAQRKDKDIDNDGDVDSSDEYLHNRRKAVKKAVSNEMSSKEKMKKGLYNGSKDEVEMNPKKKKDKSSEMNQDQMEGTLPPVYARILENRAAHYKGAHEGSPAGEGLAPSAKKAKADLEAGASYDETEEKGHDDVSKAGRAGPNGKKRPGDNKAGDKSAINPPKDTTKGGQE